VRHLGDAVAVVVADGAYQAADALEAIDVEYDPLPAVVDMEAALADGAPLVHAVKGTNPAFTWGFIAGDYEAVRARDQVPHDGTRALLRRQTEEVRDVLGCVTKISDLERGKYRGLVDLATQLELAELAQMLRENRQTQDGHSDDWGQASHDLTARAGVAFPGRPGVERGEFPSAGIHLSRAGWCGTHR
jgi:hypothetical protein